MSTIKEEIIKLESALLTQKNNLAFAERTNNSVRKSKNNLLIKETEAKIRALEIGSPIEINAELRETINKQEAEIKQFKEDIENTKQKRKQIDEQINKLVHPEIEQPKEVKAEPKPKIEPEKEPEEVKMLECVNCGKMVKGKRGMQTHLNQWCKGEVVNH